MAMSKSISVGSFVIGCTLLALTLISVICGAVAMSKVSSPAAVSVGLWGLYFVIPGVLCIVAGHGKVQSMLGVALGTNILGIILGIVGLAVAATLWAILGDFCVDQRSFVEGKGRCYCTRELTVYQYDASCSDMNTVREATGGVTIIFAFITIASFVGSIYGCMGTCCAPREPVVVMTTQVPAHTNTVVMTSSHQQQVSYGQQQQAPYGQQQQMPYGQQQEMPYGQQQEMPYGQQPPPYAYPDAPGPVVKGQL